MVVKLVTVTASARKTMNAILLLVNVTAILKHTEENVINVKPATGTSPTVSHATVMDTLELATPRPENVIIAKILQLDTIATGVLKDITAIRYSEVRLDADLAVALTLSHQVILMPRNVL